MRHLLAAALLMLAPVAPAIAQPAAETAEPAPQNAQEWTARFSQEAERALRRSDSALNTVGGNSTRPAVIAITITRDGRVARVDILRSKGKAMDRAFQRSFSNMRLPPFSPDMRGEAITIPLNIGTKRG